MIYTELYWFEGVFYDFYQYSKVARQISKLKMLKLIKNRKTSENSKVLIKCFKSDYNFNRYILNTNL